jgi:elongation factor P
MHLEHVEAAARIVPAAQEAQLEPAHPDGFAQWLLLDEAVSRCWRSPGRWASAAVGKDAASARAAIGDINVKVIASSLRKGNVVEVDGKLYVIVTAENIHPGKGTPVTQLDMRRISDGVKVSERYRTTEQVERAYVEDREHTFLYQDAEGFHFMNPETYDQLICQKDIIGDAAPYLQEGMAVNLSVHEGTPIAIELPARVVLEITDTEPTMKGQTASSSYKPAMLSNGVRTMVPPHVSAGTRIVVMTADGSYVERAKD